MGILAHLEVICFKTFCVTSTAESLFMDYKLLACFTLNYLALNVVTAILFLIEELELAFIINIGSQENILVA